MEQGFVLSIIQPSEPGAGSGKVTVCDPLPEQRNLRTPVYRALREHNPRMDPGMASRYAEQISRKDLGVETVEASTGLRFRIYLAHGQ